MTNADEASAGSMIPVSASNDSNVATGRTFRELFNSLSHKATVKVDT